MLAVELKTGTKRSHTAAENTKFVGSFLRGVVSEENYRTLIKDFYFVYSAIEEEMERLEDNEYIAPINFKELKRVEQLKMDVRYYYGPNWRGIIQPSESAIQYVERIHEVAEDNPKLLIGHHYTRYMGDLSGGVILGNITKNALKLKDKGLAFYDFPEITDKKGFKDSYRSVLDNFLPVDQQDVNAIIVEANYAFRLNMYMFEEIQGDATKGFISYACGYATSRLSYFFKVAGG